MWVSWAPPASAELAEPCATAAKPKQDSMKAMREATSQRGMFTDFRARVPGLLPVPRERHRCYSVVPSTGIENPVATRMNTGFCFRRAEKYRQKYRQKSKRLGLWRR